MISTLLIANRGEIACRVIRTARRMGVRTIAVFSDADADALHVELADEAVRIGPAPVSDSYLKGDTIIEAARRTGADAIHPGYGFLSENPDFVEAVEAAGLTFVGPSAPAIRAMGLKDAAKTRMEEAGVPVVPGYHGERQEPDFLAAKADEIGYPVLIKARAGGGGKGMRRVDDPKQFAAALEGATREGEASFGDGRVLIESYVAKPRHIEVQVFGDTHGNAVHLFERDCSLQRRHQKVIEEAPAPGMTEEMRAAMGGAAVTAAKAIGYAGAGTVEFIVDASDGLRPDRFYFMEMNTRLQVEHPVTEAITGLDLVEWQLRVASGEPLPLTQDDLAIEGHAFEARLYAEDPARDFLPSTGPLHHLRLPEGRARIDTGVREGDAVTPYYDPMIAKIITHGADRAEALVRLRAALARTEIVGCTTNADFLARLAAKPDFAAGDVDTGLIAREMEALTVEVAPSPLVRAVAALEALGLADAPGGADDLSDPWAKLTGWRAWGPAEHLVDFAEAGTLRVRLTGADAFAVEAEDGSVALRRVGPGRFESEGRITDIRSVRLGEVVTVFTDDGTHAFRLRPIGAAGQGAAGGDHVVAPMPGAVRAVRVGVGDTVSAGDAVLVMEAMKMELTLEAPRDGTVAEVLASVGDQVEDGARLIVLEAEA
ncbi:MAG: acetyl/propionyl/methylcrotonyl-CoA carboxylase subunit alpha [Pseudomonadota bacterium]